MQIISNTTEWNIDENCAVAIGKFDGIHRGHRKLIDAICEYKAQGCKAVVLTFEPSPLSFFGNGEYKGLTTTAEKRRIFEKIGVDILVEYPLNNETAAMEPERFIEEVLVRRLHAVCVACGPDFTFGFRGAGNVELLKECGQRFGYVTRVSDKECRDGAEISSTLIRNEVEAGHMDKALEYIGAPYSVTGIVEHGRQLGRTIGIPTVNLIPPEDKLLPPFGVYSAVISYKGEHYKGITNIGVKPTVTDEKSVTVETYILDFQKEIYGEYITVNLVKFIRPEQRFDSIEELKQQISRDIAMC